MIDYDPALWTPASLAEVRHNTRTHASAADARAGSPAGNRGHGVRSFADSRSGSGHCLAPGIRHDVRRAELLRP